MASRAQIIATIGPASGTPEVLERLVAAQMDVARLNMSHGSQENHKEYINNIKEVSQKSGRRIPIIMDLAGPRAETKDGHGYDSEQEAFTEKDKKDLEFGLSASVDYFALSYVGSEKDILTVKEYAKSLGKTVKVIAKIERQEALDNLAEIINQAEGVMVARGDLGTSIPIEDLPFVQERIIKMAKSVGKPVIVATEMMLSMALRDHPTKAEVTDVANAIFEQADAVMLSEETAIGKFPVETVETMEKIVKKAESRLQIPPNYL